MGKVIDYRVKLEMARLSKNDYNISAIARKLKMPVRTVWNYLGSPIIKSTLPGVNFRELSLTEFVALVGDGRSLRMEFYDKLAREKGYSSYAKLVAQRQEERQKNNSELALLIENELKRRGKSQTEIARQLGVTRATVNQVAKGKIRFSPQRLPIISSLLQIPLETLLTAGGY